MWPGETGRSERLAGAIATARRHPPALHRGDLITDLAALAGQAPSDATLVIYNCSVLAYGTEPGRRRFAETVRALGATWISSEVAGVMPVPAGPCGQRYGAVKTR